MGSRKTSRKITEQVRVLVATMSDVRALAGALGETPNNYVNRVVSEAARRDLARAARNLARRQADGEARKA